jgi:hypothetical protein
MSERIYDHRAFARIVQSAVSAAQDGDLTRAWRITRGCVTIHALVDKRPDQGFDESMNAAWDLFVTAFNDGESTYFMEALAEDFKIAAPPGLATPIIVVIEEAYKAASQNPDRQRAKKTSKDAPFPFTVLPGGEI